MRKATTVEKKVEQRNDVAHIAAIAVSVLIQIIWIWSLFWRLQEKYVWVNMAVSLFALVLVLFIYGRRVNAAIKMPWIILILVFPVLGVFFYLMVGWNPSIKQMKKRFAAIDSKLKPYLKKTSRKKTRFAHGIDGLRTSPPTCPGQPVTRFMPIPTWNITMTQRKDLRRRWMRFAVRSSLCSWNTMP